MPRRTFDLSQRHDAMLGRLKDKLEVTMVDVVQRALEALEEKEAKRDRELLPVISQTIEFRVPPELEAQTEARMLEAIENANEKCRVMIEKGDRR